MADRVRRDHIALGVLGQIESAEQNIPEGVANTEVAAIAELRIIGIRRGVVPAMHFRAVEDVVEPAALGICAAMRETAITQTQRTSDYDRHRIEADNAEHQAAQDVAQRVVERIGHQNIRILNIGHAVVIAVQLPQEVIGVFPAVHPIVPQAGEQEGRDDLNPERAQFIGQTEYDAAAEKRVRAIVQDRQQNHSHDAAQHEGLHGSGHHVPPDHVLLRLGLVIGPDALQRQHQRVSDEGIKVGERLQNGAPAHIE